ncbi:MAG: SDR family oxidoreductase [Planctomycetaceae bacterium]|nr:SDR family oxidoreductase [Planctomycetaceae bacterium]
MRVLILGGTGMLGHKTCQVFGPMFDTWTTVRADAAYCAHWPFFGNVHVIPQADLCSLPAVTGVVEAAAPDVVVNCVGVLKQTMTDDSAIEAVTLNALLPHWLDKLSRQRGFRLIQIGTDCVFSGRDGMYSERDTPDATDLYGRSKLLGEVSGPNCLTLRTSMIGRELSRTVGLLEWFLSQEGKTVKGYTRAIFSGFSTQVLAQVLADIVANRPALSGLYHVSSEPVSKFDLLRLIAATCRLDIRVEPEDKVACDRSLDSSRLRREIGFTPPSWQQMAEDLAGEIDLYRRLRT